MPSFSIMLYLWKATGVLLTVNAGARRAGALSILKSCHAITAANFASQKLDSGDPDVRERKFQLLGETLRINKERVQNRRGAAQGGGRDRAAAR